MTVAGKTAISEQFFTLIGPKVSNYSPKTGTIGDTITISGENFSSEPINKVAFNTWHGQVVSHSVNELKVIVPENLTGTTPIKVTVEVGTNKIVVGEPFGLTTPAISSVFPITARIGDTLTINGQNFSWNKEANKVTLESAQCQIVQASKSELRVIIPDHQPYDNYILPTPRDPSNLKLSIALKTSEDYREFTYLAPMYIAFSPEKGMPLDTVVLQGKNFSAFRDEWRMEVSGIAVEILNVTDNELSFVVPAEVSFNNVYFTASTIHYFWSWTYELQIPKILAVNPSQVTVGDEIEISGKYFNPSTQLNSLWLNQQPTQILFSDKSRIRAKIPSDISSQDGSINIKVQTSEHPEQWGEADNLLLLRKPEITMVSPMAVSFDEEVIIIGNYFNPKAENNFIYFNSSPAEVISASANQINARVPKELITTNGVIDITVDVGGDNSLVRDTKATMLVLKEPAINAITPTILTNLNGQVTISGSGFNPEPSFNQIVFQGLSAQILSATTSQIICQINFFEKYDPEEYVHITGLIELKCGGYAISSTQSLEVLQNKPWKRLPDFPGIQREYFVAFSVEGDGYIVGGFNPLLGLYFNEVWKYSPSNNSWIQMANFPGGARRMAKVFKIGEEVYVGGGSGKNETYNDFWRYDHASDSWTKIADFPGGPRWYPIVFGLGDKGYLGSGYSANTNEVFIDIWEYNPSINEWLRKNDITPFEEFEGSNSAASAILNGIAYVQTMSYKTDPSIQVFRIFKYDHLMDTWIKVIDIQTGQTSLATAIDNKWYMQYPYDYSESVLNIFDPLGVEIWREKSSIKKLRRGAAFAVGGKGYFLSEGYYESGQEFWELDPSKLE